jgi:tetratricopeptide (TPR) repeat protein
MTRDRTVSTILGGSAALVGACAVLTVLTAWPAIAGAQALSLKRTFPSATAGVCPSVAPPPAPPPAARVQESRRLFSLGQEASIVGDHRAARDLFRQAQELNGSDERISYYLARSDEELQQSAEAIGQYCRYLTLSPNGPDAADVRARLDRLTAPAGARGGTSGAGRRAAAAARFQAGVDAADRGRLADADRAFGDVIGQLPSAAEAYYNRGVVRAKRSDWSGAERDLRHYLASSPGAQDAAAVRERVAVLGRASTSPTTALAGGVVLPGFGQYYTGRPVLGAIVTAGTAAGLWYALRSVERTKDTTYTDLFGNPYTGQITRRGRYNESAGLAIAGGVAALGAIEGYVYARSKRSDALRLVAIGRDGTPAAEGPARRFGAWLAPDAATTASGERRLALTVGGRLAF